MEGTGREQMVEAMSQILIQENAEKNLLQASAHEVNILIPFEGYPRDVYAAVGNGSELELSIHRWRQKRPQAVRIFTPQPWRACGSWETTT